MQIDEEELNKMTERDIRVMIGDLHVQLVMLRNMVNMYKLREQNSKQGKNITPNSKRVSEADETVDTVQ